MIKKKMETEYIYYEYTTNSRREWNINNYDKQL